MKSRFWLSILAACSISTAAFASPAQVKLNSASALKEVDLGGEMLAWNDLTFLTPLLNEKFPAMVKILTQKMEEAPIINQVVKSTIKLVNVQAFKGVAASSIEYRPGIFVTKSFLLADTGARSIFIDNTRKNVALNWTQLPADTRVAIKAHINLAQVWQLIYHEMKNNPDPVIRKFTEEMDAELNKEGVDLHKLAATINGDFEILITGSNIQDVAAKVVIPDKNGAISALLKKELPPKQGSNIALIPTPLGINIQVIYEQDRIVAVSHPKLLQRPEKTLASVPHFSKYAEVVPGNGFAYAVIDIPEDVLNMVKANFNDLPELVQLFDQFIQPISIVSVMQVKSNGSKTVAASNFSLARLKVLLPGVAGFATQAAILLPALQKARDRGRQVSCINNMKQFGLACAMYADANRGMYPSNIDTLIKDKYIGEEVCENVILLYPGLNTYKVSNLLIPLAICDRTAHSEGQVCLLLADGHVETFPVSENAEDSDVVNELGKKYRLAPEVINLMLKQVDAQ